MALIKLVYFSAIPIIGFSFVVHSFTTRSQDNGGLKVSLESYSSLFSYSMQCCVPMIVCIEKVTCGNHATWV